MGGGIAVPHAISAEVKEQIIVLGRVPAGADYDALDRDQLPIMRGLELNADDLVRRAIIQALMCHFELSKESFNIAYLIDFDQYFATEMEELREYEREGLLEISPQWISVTPKGRMLIRNICMIFDKYLRTRTEHARYSKVI